MSEVSSEVCSFSDKRQTLVCANPDCIDRHGETAVTINEVSCGVRGNLADYLCSNCENPMTVRGDGQLFNPPNLGDPVSRFRRRLPTKVSHRRRFWPGNAVAA